MKCVTVCYNADLTEVIVCVRDAHRGVLSSHWIGCWGILLLWSCFVQDAEWERQSGGNPDGMWRLRTCRYDVTYRVCLHLYNMPCSLHTFTSVCLHFVDWLNVCTCVRVGAVCQDLCAIWSVSVSRLALVVTLQQQEVGSVRGWKDQALGHHFQVTACKVPLILHWLVCPPDFCFRFWSSDLNKRK